MVKPRVRTPPPNSGPLAWDLERIDENGCRLDWIMPSDVVLENMFQPRFIEHMRSTTFDTAGRCFCALVLHTASILLDMDLAARRPTSVRNFFVVIGRFCSADAIQNFVRAFEAYDRMKGILGAHETFVTQWPFSEYLTSPCELLVNPNPMPIENFGLEDLENLPRISRWQRIKHAIKRLFMDKQGRPQIERLYRNDLGKSRFDSVIQRGLSVADRGGKRKWSARWREADFAGAGNGTVEP